MQRVPFSFFLTFFTGRVYRVPTLRFFGPVGLFFNFFVAKESPVKFFDILQQTEVCYFATECLLKPKVPLLHISALWVIFQKKKIRFFKKKNVFFVPSWGKSGFRVLSSMKGLCIFRHYTKFSERKKSKLQVLSLRF